MNKKILQVLSIIEMFAALATYLLLNIEYSNSEYILDISENNTTEAKIYVICLYAIPAIYLIAGLLASIFNESIRLMIVAATAVLLTVLLHFFVVIAKFSIPRGIIALTIGMVHMYAALQIKPNNKPVDQA